MLSLAVVRVCFAEEASKPIVDVRFDAPYRQIGTSTGDGWAQNSAIPPNARRSDIARERATTRRRLSLIAPTIQVAKCEADNPKQYPQKLEKPVGQSAGMESHTDEEKTGNDHYKRNIPEFLSPGATHCTDQTSLLFEHRQGM